MINIWEYEDINGLNYICIGNEYKEVYWYLTINEWLNQGGE